MNKDIAKVEKELNTLTNKLKDLKSEIGKVIIGQEDSVEQLLITFLAGGHALLEGVPGLAKTLMIRTLAEAIDLKFKRIQFTPDLMPSDIIGTEILEEDHST
ncbi:MAG: AAA family ATPase, partial [Bacteroidia bacterium]|nr:AAA family ATPase [Bacteroidia bacterium]